MYDTVLTEEQIKKYAKEASEYIRWAESLMEEAGKRGVKGCDEYYYFKGYIEKVRIHLSRSLFSWPQNHDKTERYDRSLILSL
jgi:hypothetical protein